MVDKKTLKVLVSRKKDYLIILECIGEGATTGDLVTCVSGKELNKSPGTIVHEVVALSKYGALKASRLGKYTVIVKNVDIDVSWEVSSYVGLYGLISGSSPHLFSPASRPGLHRA